MNKKRKQQGLLDSSLSPVPHLEKIKQYCDWGLTVIPLKVGSKVPARKWKGIMHPATAAEQIKYWGKKSTKRNIGIRTGAAFDNLVVLDFDSQAAYETFQHNCPELWPLLPTVRTRRGYHVYVTVRADQTSTRNLRSQDTRQEIDIKGNGGYVVAPGSKVNIDKDGNSIDSFSYIWLIQPELKSGRPIFPITDLHQLGFYDADSTISSARAEPQDKTCPSSGTVGCPVSSSSIPSAISSASSTVSSVRPHFENHKNRVQFLELL